MNSSLITFFHPRQEGVPVSNIKIILDGQEVLQINDKMQRTVSVSAGNHWAQAKINRFYTSSPFHFYIGENEHLDLAINYQGQKEPKGYIIFFFCFLLFGVIFYRPFSAIQIPWAPIAALAIGLLGLSTIFLRAIFRPEKRGVWYFLTFGHRHYLSIEFGKTIDHKLAEILQGFL